MALEKFNTVTKGEVYTKWYPKENEAYIRFFISQVQQELGFGKNVSILRKDAIKRIIKHFGCPKTIDDSDYQAYVNALKLMDEW